MREIKLHLLSVGLFKEALTGILKLKALTQSHAELKSKSVWTTLLQYIWLCVCMERCRGSRGEFFKRWFIIMAALWHFCQTRLSFQFFYFDTLLSISVSH